MIPALFLHHPRHLEAEGGGVQLCTREYFATLERAGFKLTPLEIPYDRRLRARVKRRIWSDPYTSWFDLEESAAMVAARALELAPRFVFLNQHSLGALIALLRPQLPPATRYVVLSHGLESTDFLHGLRTPGGGPRAGTSVRDATMLGWRIVQEARQARVTDHVFCLAEFEREIEHWVGAHDVTVIPRIVEPAPLDWSPRGRRLGYVGTLDHPPNYEGLVLFLDAFKTLGLDADIRVVGGPGSVGTSLAKRYPGVTYLGALDNARLIPEVSTWSCFLHPIFCYARGASTKLATALGWEVPIATTAMGRRGYVWREGSLPEADDPVAFARLAASMLDDEEARRARDRVRQVARSSPTLDDVAALASRAIGLGGAVRD